MTTAVECPHPECQGMLKFAETLPAGVYMCICRTIAVHLEWSADGQPTLRWFDQRYPLVIDGTSE